MRFDENYNVIRDWRGELQKDSPPHPDPQDEQQNSNEQQGGEQTSSGPPSGGGGDNESSSESGQDAHGQIPKSEQLQARASAAPAGKKNHAKIKDKSCSDEQDEKQFNDLKRMVEYRKYGTQAKEASAKRSLQSVELFQTETPNTKQALDRQLRDFEQQTDPYNVHKTYRTIDGTLDTIGWKLLNERSRHQKLQRSFIQVVEKLAEDLVGYPYVGDDEWDIERIMMRSITREEIQHCRQTRDREALVLVLDTSGSCSEQAIMYSKFAEIAQQYSDIDIVIAPNAIPSLVKYGHEHEWERYNRMDIVRKSEEHKYGWVLDWPFKGRTMIFFGDLDGSDWVIRASWRNNVYWFNSETRVSERLDMERIRKYIRDEQSYQAVEYPLPMFRGKRIDSVTDDTSFLKAARRVRI